MNISFDFDSTLSQPRLQRLAKSYIEQGHNVYCVTSRMSDMTNRDLYVITDSLGLKEVVFTEGFNKHHTLSLMGIDIHFDDSYVEIDEIERNTPHIIGVHVSDEIPNL